MVIIAPMFIGLSPVAGKPMVACFDGGRLSSDAGFPEGRLRTSATGTVRPHLGLRNKAHENGIEGRVSPQPISTYLITTGRSPPRKPAETNKKA